MSNEIQVMSDNAALAPRPNEQWGAPVPYTPQPAGGPAQSSAFKKMHRLLRGRYKLGITLGVACAMLGAAGGWLSRRPLWTSEAVFMIRPTVSSPNPDRPDFYMPGADTFVKMQMLEMESPDRVRQALQNNAQWKAVHPWSEDQINVFLHNLEVEQVPLTNLIKLSYSDVDPQSAQAGLSGLCSQYVQWATTQDPTGRQAKIRLARDQANDLGVKLSDLQHDLENRAQKYGTTDLDAYLQGEMMEELRLETEVSEASLRLDQEKMALREGGNLSAANASAKTAQANAQGTQPLTAEQIVASGDRGIQPFATNVDVLKQDLLHLQKRGYEINSPVVLNMQGRIEDAQLQLENYVSSFNAARANPSSTMTAGVGSSALPTVVTQADVDQASKTYEILKAQYEKKREEVADVGSTAGDVKNLQSQIDQYRSDLAVITKQITEMEGMTQLDANQIEPEESATLPAQPDDNKRKMMSVLGFIGGGALPFCVLMLFGLVDSRYRYSDETNNDMSGIPLLGILPNLPDLLSDPEQAATAAHCVHQIRTLLQINGHVTDRRVYCITSGSSGDGKTSLTLALGLSFAASGSRTLLIDGDLVGAGLTARLGVRTSQGVLEAMASRNINEFVRATDVADLAILPVGDAMGAFAGTISPAAVRRMITEVRKQYDTILIDTGPILGSIEASPIAVASDAVILCVSRGQQRPLVDRAMAHLQTIGARLAGVVFNRAQARDFETSVSRLTYSVPRAQQSNGQARTSGHLGPVAKAVATSVRPNGNSSDMG